MLYITYIINFLEKNMPRKTKKSPRNSQYIEFPDNESTDTSSSTETIKKNTKSRKNDKNIKKLEKQYEDIIKDKKRNKQEKELAYYNIAKLNYKKNKNKIKKLYEETVNNGYALAALEFAKLLDKEDLKDYNKSKNYYDIDELRLKHYKKALNSENNNIIDEETKEEFSNIAYQFALFYENNLLQPNMKKAKEYYKLSADSGNVKAMVDYAEILSNGKNLKDKKEARGYYNMAKNKNIETNENKYKNLLKDIKYLEDLEENEEQRKSKTAKKVIEVGESYIINRHIEELVESLNNDSEYKVEEKLGNGGEGTVYSASKNKTSEKFAAKFPSCVNPSKPEKEKINREKNMRINTSGGGSTKVIEEIKAKTIRNTYNIEISKKMDYDLYTTMYKNNGKFPLFYYMVQLANNFKNLHSQGIIHRDVKPENVLIKNKRIKIADFGMSSYREEDFIGGTREYIAPELKKTKKSDVFSTGIMFFEMLIKSCNIDFYEALNDIFGQDFDYKSVNNADNFIEFISKYRSKSKVNKEKLEEIIERIKIEDLFPGITVNDGITLAVKSKLTDLLFGMLQNDPSKRPTMEQVTEKLGEILMIVGKEKNLEDLGFKKKDLHGAGVYNEEILDDRKDKLKEDLNLLQGSIENPTEKQKTHLQILTNGNKLPKVAVNCLKFISKYLNNEKINVKDKMSFERNLEMLKSNDIFRQDYVLISTMLVKCRELQLDYKSLEIKTQKNQLETEILDKIKEKKELLSQTKENLLNNEEIRFSLDSILSENLLQNESKELGK